MRDVSHQSIGGEILGLSPHNFNMMRKFAANISNSKDWCTFWEINCHDRPAPVDYTDDKQFWYPLTASPDVIQTCYRLYEWTGNRDYLSDPVLCNFYETSLTVYLDRWKLNPDQLANRPRIMNGAVPLRPGAMFTHVRGFPTYVESRSNAICGVDLIAALYAGCHAYGEMLRLRGNSAKAATFLAKAEAYKTLINTQWWNERQNRYETSLLPDGTFCVNDGGAIHGETYILWFNASSSPSRSRGILDSLAKEPCNIENRSHYPYLMYRYRFPENAYRVLVSLKDMERSRYPEVSFGVMEGIVAGVLGVRPSASQGVVRTLAQLRDETEWGEVKTLPALGTVIGVRHDGNGKTTFTNNGLRAVKWRACFYSDHGNIRVDGEEIRAESAADEMGNRYSFIDVMVASHASATARVGSP